MVNEQQKCPICGTKLKMINGKMTCKDCGYYLRNESADESADFLAQSPQASEPQPAGTVPQPRPQPVSQTIPQTVPSAKASTYTSGRYHTGQSGGSGKVAAIVIAVWITISIVSYTVFAIVQRNSKPDEETSGQSGRTSKNEQVSSSSNGPAKQTSYLPRTYFFQELVSVIFEKDYTDVTPEEMASITSLEIDFDNNEIYYQIDYVDGIYLTFDSGISVDFSDLKRFPGLEWVSLIGKGLHSGDLDGLENLIAVYSENSLKELADIVPYPENILELSVYDSFTEHSLAGAEKFPNLQYLSVEYYGLEDISDLVKMPKLLGLALTDCDRLTDFSPLMQMTGLEQLSITSPQLKSIDFVSVMPNLIYLGVEDSQIPNINALSNCPNLSSLYLMNNYSVEDYNVVGDLVNLTDLTIFKSAHAPIPSLEKLTKLETASFGKLWEGELPLVTAAGNISQLYLETNYDDYNLKMLAELPLTWLSMVSCSISGDHPLEFLTRMPELTYLNLTRSHVFGNMEEIFGIPTLEYLYLKETSGVIDFEQLPSNANLLLLDVSGLKLKAESWGQEYLDIKDHYDMFEKYPNVEYLYAASLGIDNIDFVLNMPNLQYLNIIENNVTSLKPLENLNRFYTVLCGGNTILEYASEEYGIYVDTDSDYYPYK